MLMGADSGKMPSALQQTSGPSRPTIDKQFVGEISMKSPFPGMDPYLEKHWGDVHHRLITYACDQLQPDLPDNLLARVEERVFLEFEGAQRRNVYPDVRVVETRGPRQAAPSSETGTALAEPLLIHIDDEPMTQGYIEIIDVGTGNRVVTVIEFVSPSNKTPGPGRTLYGKKQDEVLNAGASLVEIDLTRSGNRDSVFPLDKVPLSRRTTYQVCVRRGWRSRVLEVYPVPLPQPLPTIPIPLRETDPDARLDLQALIDQCYRNGRYDRLDYMKSPDPPLDPDDAAWADEVLRAEGRQPEKRPET